MWARAVVQASPRAPKTNPCLFIHTFWQRITLFSFHKEMLPLSDAYCFLTFSNLFTWITQWKRLVQINHFLNCTRQLFLQLATQHWRMKTLHIAEGMSHARNYCSRPLPEMIINLRSNFITTTKKATRLNSKLRLTCHAAPSLATLRKKRVVVLFSQVIILLYCRLWEWGVSRQFLATWNATSAALRV